VFRGSLPGLGVVPAMPVVSMSATPGGYLLIAADGGTFAFGSAGFYGSLPGIAVTPNSPVIGLVPGSAGYLMLGRDGGIFNFGKSQFHGALVGYSADEAVAVTVSDDLSDYLILTTAGEVFTFDDSGIPWYGTDIFRGEGDQIISYPINNPVIVDSVLRVGYGNFSVWSLDSSNTRVELLANTVGTELQRRYTYKSPTASLEINANGAWVIRVMPVTYAKKWRPSTGSFSGSGEDVLLVAQSPSARVFNNSSTRLDSGSDLLTERQYTQPLEANDSGNLLINELGGYDQMSSLLDVTKDAWVLAIEAGNTSWEVSLS